MARTKAINSQTLIAPSILSADFRRLGEEIALVEAAGADWIHLDVMDGHFVPNLSFGPMIVGYVNQATDLFLDAHLMIDNPGDYLEAFKKAGADLITVHAEVPGAIPAVLDRIRAFGLKAGISINPETPVEALDSVYDLVDLILIMSVHPGFGGQQFMSETLRKVEHIAQRAQTSGREIWIEIDGGIGPDNAGQVRRAGANVLVAGNSIFRQDDPALALQVIRRAADQAI